MACGDVALEEHLNNARKQYVSPAIQNEIIEICGKVIVDKIVSKVNQAKFYSILADETTDISGIEQFTLCVRYVDTVGSSLFLREDFLKFLPVTDVTGEGLTNTLLETVREMQFSLEYLSAQGYDSAASMSGRFKGCAAKISNDYAQAI